MAARLPLTAPLARVQLIAGDVVGVEDARDHAGEDDEPHGQHFEVGRHYTAHLAVHHVLGKQSKCHFQLHSGHLAVKSTRSRQAKQMSFSVAFWASCREEYMF